MKDLLALSIMNVPAISSVVIAGLLAYHDKSGWGWFLFISVLLSVSVKHYSID